jgi:hypothetical protein
MATHLLRLQEWSYDRGDHEEVVMPVGVGLFEGVVSDPPGYQTVEEQGVATKEIIDKYAGLLDDGKIHLLATHRPPHEVVGPKIILIRDPREVAVSYSHWWASTAGLTEEQRREFLSDWVHRSALRVKKKWEANIKVTGWTSWHQHVEPGFNVIRFEDISAGRLQEVLRKFGIRTRMSDLQLNFRWLQAGDPIMYRRGERCLDEFPEELQPEALARWGSLIEKFWP